MQTPTLLSLVAVSAAAALPQASAPSSSVNPWTAPGPTDSRGPCPMLNTLANHGYLPHSGRNLSIEDFATAIHEGINWQASFGEVFASRAFALLGSPSAIDLEDLGTPDATEHRASLTREDAPAGDSLRLSPERLEALLADAPADYLDVASAAAARVRVEALSGEPALGTLAATQAMGEAALLLLAVADGPVPEPPANLTAAAGATYDGLRAPKDRAAAWLAAEELPVALGWRAPERELGLADVQGLSAAIAAAKASLLES